MFTSIAIIGRPNVGKSTLFNKLTKTREAIVSDFPGLTKDRNYGYLKLGSFKSMIIDTGGIGKDSSSLSQNISDQAWVAAHESNLILFLIDGSENLSSEDFEILSRLRKINKPFLTLLNFIQFETFATFKFKSFQDKTFLKPFSLLKIIASSSLFFLSRFWA